MTTYLRFATLLAVLACTSVSTALGQHNFVYEKDSTRAIFRGTLQPRATFTRDSYATFTDQGNFQRETEEHVGVGIRRLRLIFQGWVSDQLNVWIQYEAGTQDNTVGLLDARIAYKVLPKTYIRFGRFVGAQPRSFGLTFHNHLDGINRPAIAEDWARNTRGADGRDFGIELYRKTDLWHGRLFIHNGYNQAGFRTSISSHKTAARNETNLAIGGYLGHNFAQMPLLEVGAYTGYNFDANPRTELFGKGREYMDYSAHVYYGAMPGSAPFRIKADFIGIAYQPIDYVIYANASREEISYTAPTNPGDPLSLLIEEGNVAQHSVGASLFLAWGPKSFLEFYTRGEYMRDFDPLILQRPGRIDDETTILTLGGCFSLSALYGGEFIRSKLNVEYNGKYGHAPELGDAHSFQAQWQLMF